MANLSPLNSTAQKMRYVWLDVDPGHDDATALMLAVHSPEIHLLGVSTTHGNASADNTAKNAARCLLAFGAPEHVRVYPGANKPLLLPAKHDPEIHGPDGLGGVDWNGLPDGNSLKVRAWFARSEDGTPIRALEGMVRAIRDTWDAGKGHQVSVVSSGPMTNIALFVSVYPDLLEAVDEFVFMGGAVGMGNRSSVAEYNILCDPHAAQIVLDVPKPKIMIPINVTHTALVTKEIFSRLLSPDVIPEEGAPLPKPLTSLRHTLSTLLSYFADAYKATFGFNDPPLHDALTIAYLSHPEMFKGTRYRVDVELTGKHTTGETVVDIWQYQRCDDSWGAGGKNCLVAQSVDVNAFFDFFLQCVVRCDKVSPLNI